RRVVYTTNTVESLHMQIRKTIKTRGHVPNDEAALRLIWLAVQRGKGAWRSCYNWTQAMAVLRIHFGDRIPDNASPPPDTQKHAQALSGVQLVVSDAHAGLRKAIGQVLGCSWL